MAKAKQKRIKKELSKLQRSGRHLEWLAEVQGLPITPELKREMDQAWQEVQRRSLRTRPAFYEFCAQVNKIEPLPQTPEIHFLRAVKDLLANGTDEGGGGLAVTGLSGIYQAAQQNLIATLQAPRNWQAIEDLLALIASAPEKITRKQYQDLAKYFSATFLEAPFLALGEGMAVFRRLNHKTHLHKPLSPKLRGDLNRADHQMATATRPLPPALRQLVFLPFASQVLLYLRQCSPAPEAHQVQKLIHSVETTFMEGAGKQLPQDLLDRLFADDDAVLSEEDLEKMAQDFSSAPLEGKLTLLSNLRQAFHKASSMEMGGNPFFSNFFDDDTEEMERLLIRFHKQVLKEIGQRLPNLASRERRALIAIVDSMLARDISDLLFAWEEGQALIDVLLLAAEAGCLGTRLSLLALLLAGRKKSKRLATYAVKALQEAPAPGLADLRWLMDEHGPPTVRSAEVLKTLFEKIRGKDDLARYMVEAVWKEVSNGISFNTFASKINPAMRHPDFSHPSLDLFTPAEIKQLAELASQVTELEPLSRFLALFPEGRIDPENLRQWLEDTWMREENCTLFIETVQTLITGTAESMNLLDIFKSAGAGGNFAAIANKMNSTKVVIDFFRDHADDFRRLPLHPAEIIVNEIFPHLTQETDYGSLLIKTYNALSARVSAGEKAFTALRDALNKRLRAMAGGNQGRGRGSRR